MSYCEQQWEQRASGSLTLKTSLPRRQTTLCSLLQAAGGSHSGSAARTLGTGPRQGRLTVNRNKLGKKVDDSPGITSQMGTRRVCSKLAKLHSNFPLNAPSQSPIGLSCKRCKSERRGTLGGGAHPAPTHRLEATSVFSQRDSLRLDSSHLLLPKTLRPLHQPHTVQALTIDLAGILSRAAARASSCRRKGEAGCRGRQNTGLSSAACWHFATLWGHPEPSLYHAA